MTEEEWLCRDKSSSLLLGVLLGNFRSQVSDRQLRLLICGCVRQLPKQSWPEQLATLIEYAESYADGIVSLDEVNAFRGSNHLRHSDDWSIRVKKRIQERVLAGRKQLWQMAMAQSNAVVTSRSRASLGPAGASSDVQRQQSIEMEQRFISSLVYDIVPNPFQRVSVDPSCLTSTVIALAEGIYADRAFDRMPILADALQDAGWDNEAMLRHCREPGEHVRGCWVIDLVTGRK